MKALVVGSGEMAAIRLQGLREAGIHATVVSRTPEHAKRLVQPGLVDVCDVRDINAVEADFVFICSATVDHERDLDAVIDRGIPVLCEKPVAHGTQAAAALVRRALAASTPFYVAFMRRFDTGFRQLRRHVLKGDAGTLYHLRGAHYDRYAKRRDFIANSGGHFRDMLVHDIDIVLWLTGQRVKQCHAWGSVRLWQDYAEFDDCDVASILLTLDNGLTASIQSSRAHPYGLDVRFEVLGSEGAFATGIDERTPIVSCEPGPSLLNVHPPQHFGIRFGEAFATETREFIEFAVGRRASFDGCNAADAATVLRIAEACDESWRTARPVELS